MTNPYKSLPDYCFWSRAMTQPAPWQIDPVVRHQPVRKEDRVSTMGSCFAQHLAKHIQSSGVHYFVPESAPPELSREEARRRNYGVFSARYGNVYTVRQALQLFRRVYGKFRPSDSVWPRGDRFVDAFRPQIDPDGYATPDEVLAAADEHLEHVREVFERSDWLVFTLGLTEAWRSKIDGAIYPTAPGVAGGDFDAERYEFVNFSADEVREDLFALISELKVVNPRIKILLTVSPVPLIATYERRHVWVSTTVSKAILRVAADEAERKFENVIYFPSYEIITSPAAGNNYYADDLREVVDRGVQHVMRVFTKYFLDGATRATHEANKVVETNAPYSQHPQEGIVCDEEVIEETLRESNMLGEPEIDHGLPDRRHNRPPLEIDTQGIHQAAAYQLLQYVIESERTGKGDVSPVISRAAILDAYADCLDTIRRVHE